LDTKGLLERFRRKEASSEELKMLYSKLKEENNREIMELIEKEWETISGEGNPANSDTILQNIHEKIGQKPDKKHRVIALRRIWQYAAIFILAFTLSWFLRTPSQKTIAHTDIKKANYFNIKVPYGSKTTIELPDSTKVILNSGSSLQYADDFGDSTRTVYLNGEAFFDVTRDKLKPFYVKTHEATIKVLGTQFNVKAYPRDDIMETTIVSGSVEVFPTRQTYNGEMKEYKRILLKPNEKIVIARDTITKTKAGEGIIPDNSILKATIAAQAAEETQTDIAWKNNVLILSNEPLSEIITKLERWFNADITMNDNELGRVRFSARFSGESISEVLYALSLTQPFTYDIKKNVIKIETIKR